MVLPNAVIAGVNKAGTTSLFHALAQQPRVHPSQVKETHFFDPLKYGEELPPLQRYEELFPQAPHGDLVLEATPGYFYGGRPLAEAMAGVLPDARVAIVLREPGARAFSWWRFCRSRLLVDPDLTFGQYLAECARLDRKAEEDRGLVGWRALSGGRYSDYLPSWQETFGDRLLVVFYDDLRHDFAGTVARVGRHFGADVDAAVRSRDDNVTTDVSNRTLQRVALTVNRSGERLWRAAPGLKRLGRRIYYRVNARAAQQRLSDHDRAWLTDWFAEEREQLRALIPSRERPGWLEADR